MHLEKGHYLIPLFLAILIQVPLLSQETTDSLRLGIRPYGSFRGHLAYYNDELELQENASRIGFEISMIKNKVRYFVAAELGINLFQSNVVFNADASTRGGFIVVESSQDKQVFSTRLGYLGVDMGPLGVLTIGKQWSVYYDITGYTDKFNVFGGQGSSTYVAGTDGGTTGTGRVDQSLMYRNAFGPFRVGAQIQVRTTANNRLLDGFALSGQYSPMQDVSLGVAFAQSYFNEDLMDGTIGFENNPTYLSLGGSYGRGNWDIGVVYARQTHGDATESFIDLQEGATVVFNGWGLEAFVKYNLDKLSLLGGYNGYFPETEGLPIYQEFERQFFLLGLEYRPLKAAYFYSEYRIANGENPLGIGYFNVFTVGLRIDLERTWSRSFPVN